MAIIYPDMYNRPEKYTNTNNDEHFNLRDDGKNVNMPERIISVAAGVCVLSSGFRSVFNNPLSGMAKIIIGGTLLSRGVNGYCPLYDSLDLNSARPEVINIKQRLIVDKPREEVYQFWRKLENLPLFMRHVVSVKEDSPIRSTWKAKFSKNGPPVTWKAEIVKEIPNQLLGWHSVLGSVVDHGGKVEFNDIVGGGTELQVIFSYQSPIGNLGTGIARLFTPSLEKVIREDILYFKNFIETKEIPHEEIE